jgi:hypothetical protein
LRSAAHRLAQLDSAAPESCASLTIVAARTLPAARARSPAARCRSKRRQQPCSCLLVARCITGANASDRICKLCGRSVIRNSGHFRPPPSWRSTPAAL